MDELKFVIKTFCFTCVLIVLLQVKVGGGTIESHSYHWLRYSGIAQFIQNAAAGGALALRNFSVRMKENFAGTVSDFKKEAQR